MNKQELLEKIKALKPDEQCLHEYQPEEWEAFQDGFDDGKCYVELIIEQLDEPEKPVVPQFVADWLEVCKDNLALSLASSMNNIVMRTNNQPDKTIRWIAKNSETFAKAWIYGYEVQKEKLYTVEIPNPNGSEYRKIYLAKNKDGKVELFTWSGYTSIEFADKWKQEENAQLTESEIKKDFDWAWDFVEEVKEW